MGSQAEWGWKFAHSAKVGPIKPCSANLSWTGKISAPLSLNTHSSNMPCFKVIQWCILSYLNRISLWVHISKYGASMAKERAQKCNLYVSQLKKEMNYHNFPYSQDIKHTPTNAMFLSYLTDMKAYENRGLFTPINQTAHQITVKRNSCESGEESDRYIKSKNSFAIKSYYWQKNDPNSQESTAY